MAAEFTSSVGADESGLRVLAAAMVVPATQRRHPSGFEQTKGAECGILAKAWLRVVDCGMLRAVWFALQETVTFNLFAPPCSGIFVLLTQSTATVLKARPNTAETFTILQRKFLFLSCCYIQVAKWSYMFR